MLPPCHNPPPRAVPGLSPRSLRPAHWFRTGVSAERNRRPIYRDVRFTQSTFPKRYITLKPSRVLYRYVLKNYILGDWTYPAYRISLFRVLFIHSRNFKQDWFGPWYTIHELPHVFLLNMYTCVGISIFLPNVRVIFRDTTTLFLLRNII